MQEIIVKNNPTNFRVFINGIPNLKIIPKDEAESTVAALELQIAGYYEKKRKEENPDKD